MVDNWTAQFDATVTPNSSLFSDQDQDPENAVIFCGLMILFLIIGVVGHITVLLSVIYYEELQRPLNVLIVNLSISQFFTLVIPVFADIIVMLNRTTYLDEIDNSDVLCFFALLFSTSTSVSYGFIALNRLFSTIFETFYARWSWTMVWSLVLTGWVLSAIGSAVPWMTSMVTFGRNGYFISGFPWFSPSAHSTSLYWFLISAYFFLPAISLVGISVAVVLFSWRTQRNAGLALNSPRAVTLRDRFRVMLMLVVCSAIYIIFFYTGYIYWNLGRRTRSANYFFLWIVFVQNALNPYVFGIVQPQFREAYVRVMFWIIRKWSCRNSYGDSRRVFPAVAASSEMVRPPTSVTFQAKNNPQIVFHPNALFQSSSNGNSDSNHRNAELGLRAPSSSNNLELRVVEISASKTSDGL